MAKKKQFREREKSVLIRPYEYTLHVVVSNDLEKSYNKRKLRTNSPEFGNPYAFVWFKEGCGELFAFLPEKCGLGATAHEMFHVVYFVMRGSGVRLSRSSEEAWTYLIGELTQTVAEFVHAKDKNKYRKVNNAKQQVSGSVSNRKTQRVQHPRRKAVQPRAGTRQG